MELSGDEHLQLTPRRMNALTITKAMLDAKESDAFKSICFEIGGKLIIRAGMHKLPGAFRRNWWTNFHMQELMNCLGPRTSVQPTYISQFHLLSNSTYPNTPYTESAIITLLWQLCAI